MPSKGEIWVEPIVGKGVGEGGRGVGVGGKGVGEGGRGVGEAGIAVGLGVTVTAGTNARAVWVSCTRVEPLSGQTEMIITARRTKTAAQGTHLGTTFEVTGRVLVTDGRDAAGECACVDLEVGWLSCEDGGTGSEPAIRALNAWALGGRWSGSFRMACRMALAMSGEMLGLASPGGTSGSRIMRWMLSTGTNLVSKVYRVAPRA